MRSWQRCLASLIGIIFLTPRFFASFEQAMTQVKSVVSNGITPTGLPCSFGSACCSTEAKKPSKSRYNCSGVSGFLMLIIKRT